MTKTKDITPGMSRSVLPTSSQSDVNEGTPSTTIISDENNKVNVFDEKTSKKIDGNENIRYSRRLTDSEIDKWFDSLTFEELNDLIKDDASIQDTLAE